MNKRIRSIFWLMTACIVAINAFQGYWLWTTYLLNRQQFLTTVQDAWFQAMEGQQVASARQLFFQKDDKEVAVPGQKPRLLIRYKSQEVEQNRYFYHTEKDGLALRDLQTPGLPATNTPPLDLSADTLASRLSKRVMRGWAKNGRIDLKRFEKNYRAELKRRGIDVEFKLDSLVIKPEKREGFMVVFDSETYKSPDDGVLRTIPLPINPLRHLFVQASFLQPVPYLLQRMGWLLGSSVLLLILTTGCFMLMLTTILRQKKLAEVKNDFINNMTHELKTPISTVTAAIEALLHFGALKDPVKTNDYLTISQNNMHRLSDLVEKVLNLAVEEKQELELYPESINLSELVGTLVADHRVRAVKPVNFKLDIPEAATVSVDKVHFGNVLNNLIDNAINYSEEQVVVRMNYRQEQDGWQLAVADNGIGIPKVYHTVIFDRFFRVPTGNLHAVKGFGLGLAYVRQVVERHGGSIRVTSEPGKGSEFILKF
ncbi:sensor histidine kinase [Dyadobacter pollutisoli]|uniref:histidine kinase n=1 Tax=Dyadobacter pollutisoli TaxID=2910158 RepID=A0A9E8NFX7_9BACT|nr:HAMP domain-containing sensor histidine kinase [Dyadobacter pollutisoli]WAC14563.1 HAMP domain-containing sensor histidine kinase [Dyadobacter pollutisoli]